MFNRTLWTHSRHPPGPSSPPRSSSTNINTTLIVALSHWVGGDQTLAKERLSCLTHSTTLWPSWPRGFGAVDSWEDRWCSDELRWGFPKVLLWFCCFQCLASRLLGTFRHQSPPRPASGSPGNRHPAMWRDTRWPFIPREMTLTWGSYWSVPTTVPWSWRNSGEHPRTGAIGRCSSWTWSCSFKKSRNWTWSWSFRKVQ